MILSHTPPCSCKSKEKEKEKKRNINNDLAILPSHDTNKVPNRPWEIISIDLITQLPESNSYNAICVIVDRLTKRAHFISINNWFLSKDMV